MGIGQNILREIQEDGEGAFCNHRYSKGWNEPRPRLCIQCKAPEICKACEGEETLHMCGKKFTVDVDKQSAIDYATDAIKVCDEKIKIEGPEGAKQWLDLKVAWQKHLKTVKNEL